MTYKVILIGNKDHQKAKIMIRELKSHRSELKEIYEREQKLNDSKSDRLKDKKETLDAVDDAIEWMEKPSSLENLER
ncbi:hypothetical protein DRQ25_15515 [Candidatus Fermentibacteria bacterium]|nr:MAG: hypothetical protein DRQ25_15515 [Candidatus Fermentibacteria bacterium]